VEINVSGFLDVRGTCFRSYGVPQTCFQLNFD